SRVESDVDDLRIMSHKDLPLAAQGHIPDVDPILYACRQQRAVAAPGDVPDVIRMRQFEDLVTDEVANQDGGQVLITDGDSPTSRVEGQVQRQGPASRRKESARLPSIEIVQADRSIEMAHRDLLSVRVKVHCIAADCVQGMRERFPAPQVPDLN